MRIHVFVTAEVAQLVEHLVVAQVAVGSSPIFRPIRKSPRFRAGFFFFCRWLRPDSPSAALCREPRPGVRKDKSRLYSRVHGRGYASFAGKGLREILFRRGGKGQVRPACSLSSLSIDGALSAVVICLASERGLRSCPAGGGFSLRQATPLASRRAALAKAGPFAYKTSHHGAWRSMVAHLLWEQGVAGSNPVAPTIHKNKRSAVTGWPLFVFSAAKICLREQEQPRSASGQAGPCRICPAAAAGEERGMPVSAGRRLGVSPAGMQRQYAAPSGKKKGQPALQQAAPALRLRQGLWQWRCSLLYRMLPQA